MATPINTGSMPPRQLMRDDGRPVEPGTAALGRRALLSAAGLMAAGAAAAAVAIGSVSLPVVADDVTDADRNLLRFLREASPKARVSYYKTQLGLALAGQTECGWVVIDCGDDQIGTLLFSQLPGTPEGIGFRRV